MKRRLFLRSAALATVLAAAPGPHGIRRARAHPARGVARRIVPLAAARALRPAPWAG
ncbi:MAG: hypothetical protein KJ579_06010 [Verrucomicrobia bacterium]|nr:hypothetical protein [Verrucomicrobiota bacterium]